MNPDKLADTGKQIFAVGCGLYALVAFLGCIFVVFAMLFG